MRKKIIIITGLILFGGFILFNPQIHIRNNKIQDVTIENAEVLASVLAQVACDSDSDCALEEGNICVYRKENGSCGCKRAQLATLQLTVTVRVKIIH